MTAMQDIHDRDVAAFHAITGRHAPSGRPVDCRLCRPEHRRARERTDEEQAALDEWARSEVQRHLGHGCTAESTHCVLSPPTGVVDSPEAIEAWARRQVAS